MTEALTIFKDAFDYLSENVGENIYTSFQLNKYDKLETIGDWLFLFNEILDKEPNIITKSAFLGADSCLYKEIIVLDSVEQNSEIIKYINILKSLQSDYIEKIYKFGYNKVSVSEKVNSI